MQKRAIIILPGQGNAGSGVHPVADTLKSEPYTATGPVGRRQEQKRRCCQRDEPETPPRGGGLLVLWPGADR